MVHPWRGKTFGSKEGVKRIKFSLREVYHYVEYTVNHVRLRESDYYEPEVRECQFGGLSREIGIAPGR